MIAIADKNSVTIKKCRARPARCGLGDEVRPAWHAGYVQILPSIRRRANSRLRHLREEARAEALQEVICDTVVAYKRLAELGKEDVAFATPLVMYAVAKFRDGRRVGTRLNVYDVTSEYSQRRKGVIVERLDRISSSNSWKEVLIEDGHASPADIAAMRIDFCDWLRRLPARTRQIALLLATGESTLTAARTFGVSAGRISQLRQSLRRSWYLFVREITS